MLKWIYEIWMAVALFGVASPDSPLVLLPIPIYDLRKEQGDAYGDHDELNPFIRTVLHAGAWGTACGATRWSSPCFHILNHRVAPNE